METDTYVGSWDNSQVTLDRDGNKLLLAGGNAWALKDTFQIYNKII